MGVSFLVAKPRPSSSRVSHESSGSCHGPVSGQGQQVRDVQMLADALARSDLRYLFVQGGVVLHGERNSMAPGFEFSLGDANLALIVASLFSLDARFLDHASPLLVVRLDLL